MGHRIRWRCLFRESLLLKQLQRGATLVALVLFGSFLLAGCSDSDQDAKGLSDPAVVTYLAEQGRALAQSYGLSDPPSVDPIRLIALDEWGSTQVQCLVEAGFDVTSSSDGEGISFSGITDPALQESLNYARYTCEMQYPVAPQYMEPLSEDRLARLYAYRVNVLIPCLEDAGQRISPPPSEMTFIESGGAWSPFEDVSAASEEITELMVSCPQIPADLYE